MRTAGRNPLSTSSSDSYPSYSAEECHLGLDEGQTMLVFRGGPPPPKEETILPSVGNVIALS